MPLTVPCLKCKAKFVVKSKLAGRPVTCTACGFVMTLPPLKRILDRRRSRGARPDRARRASDPEPLPMLELVEEIELVEDVEPDVEESTATDFEPPAKPANRPPATPAEPVTVACPHCGGPLFHEPGLAGQVVACPYCAGHLQMPRL
jgi:DNA-directed RNA polymerase subunit RPC12/RpoP